MAHVDPRSLSPEAQEALRRRAVQMVLEQREPIGRTARLLGVSRMAVSTWVKAVRAGGAAALAAQPRGRKPGHTKLTRRQVRQVLGWVRDRCPDQLKLPFYLWTQEAVRGLIARRLGLTVSRSTAGRLLRAHGFSAQKPVRRSFEQNPEAVQKWLEEDYPAIKAQAKAERAVILWGDETGMRSDHQTGTSYAPVGRTPVIPGTGRRFGCNMISALSNRGQLQFMIFKGKFHAPVCLKFLRRLLKNNVRKVYLIWDGHPVHRSAKVGRFVAEQVAKLRVFPLPAYSPELNPDELVNQDVKSNAVGRKRPRTQRQMIGQIRTHMQDRQNDPALVRRYFREESVRYAAA
jgi:transposase